MVSGCLTALGTTGSRVLRRLPVRLSPVLFAAAVVAALGACASHTPKPVMRSPALTALPAKASFAWVRPAEMFSDATSGDEESAGTGAARSMRLDVEALLLGQGWTMAPAESAQFVASIVIMQRTAYRTETRGVQSSPPPPPCDLTRSGRACPASIAPQTQTVNVPVGETHAVFAIGRRADRAVAQRTSPEPGTQQSGGYFVKELIALLRAAPRK